jgi:hypothetical protein
MEPEMNEGGDIFDAIGAQLETLISVIGPEEVLAMLQEAVTMVEQGGEQPPEAMPQGGPQAMPAMGGMDPMTRALMGKR